MSRVRQIGEKDVDANEEQEESEQEVSVVDSSKKKLHDYKVIIQYFTELLDRNDELSTFVENLHICNEHFLNQSTDGYARNIEKICQFLLDRERKIEQVRDEVERQLCKFVSGPTK